MPASARPHGLHAGIGRATARLRSPGASCGATPDVNGGADMH